MIYYNKKLDFPNNKNNAHIIVQETTGIDFDLYHIYIQGEPGLMPVKILGDRERAIDKAVDLSRDSDTMHKFNNYLMKQEIKRV